MGKSSKPTDKLTQYFLSRAQQGKVIEAYRDLMDDPGETVDWSKACEMAGVEFFAFEHTKRFCDGSEGVSFAELVLTTEAEMEERVLGRVRAKALNGDMAASRTLIGRNTTKTPAAITLQQFNQFNAFGQDGKRGIEQDSIVKAQIRQEANARKSLDRGLAEMPDSVCRDLVNTLGNRTNGKEQSDESTED